MPATQAIPLHTAGSPGYSLWYPLLASPKRSNTSASPTYRLEHHSSLVLVDILADTLDSRQAASRAFEVVAGKYSPELSELSGSGCSVSRVVSFPCSRRQSLLREQPQRHRRQLQYRSSCLKIARHRRCSSCWCSYPWILRKLPMNIQERR